MSIQGMISNWQVFFDEEDDDTFEELLSDISDEADQLDNQIEDAKDDMRMALNALLIGNEKEAQAILERAIGTIEPVALVPESVVKTWWVGGRLEMRGQARPQ